MKKQVRGLVKKIFALLGLHVRRINPADDNHRWLERYGINTVIDVDCEIFSQKIDAQGYETNVIFSGQQWNMKRQIFGCR